MAEQENGLALAMQALAARLEQVSGELMAIRQMLEARSERDEFAQILAGLKHRGLITQADVDRLERDGLKESPRSESNGRC